jgi:hypothetical protein
MKKVSGGVTIRKCARCLAELECELKGIRILKASANHQRAISRNE